MNEEDRSNPDELLQAIKKQETTEKKGRLKIFLGMAAGVGKTYTMLESAQQLFKQGKDVLIGVINTHGRKETIQLTEGLPILPLKKITYQDIEFEEMDLDKILELKPQLVLVDEFAHTNIPGSRHSKRWQDVIEILDNGIDVYTTLNVQHIESLKDIVENITNIKIRETVPDSIVASATFIELVDITPDELLERLRAGKVYLGDKSELAIKNFFQEDHLTALREIVLRYTAEKVDSDLRELGTTDQRVIDWKPREKLLVSISEKQHSQKLIRATRRIAANLNAPWIAVYVNDGSNLSEAEHDTLAKNISLARDLGAEVITTNDPSIAEGIQRVANRRGITQIILGEAPKAPLFGFFGPMSLVEKIAEGCPNIDVHLIREDRGVTKVPKKLFRFQKQNLISYFYVFLVVGVLTWINWLVLPFIDYKVVSVVFLMGILSLSLFFKKGPIFFGSFLYAIFWISFFVPPTYSFKVHSYEDLSLLALFLITSLTTGILVDRAREHKEMLEKRERFVESLYNIVRNISNASTQEEIFKTTKEYLEKLLDGQIEIAVKEIDGGLEIDKNSNLISDEKEISAAIWVFESKKEAGWSTETLPFSKNFYIPLKGIHETVGVLAFRSNKQKTLSLEEKNFLYTVSQQVASQIERLFSDKRSKQHEQMRLIEKLYENILKKISAIIKPPIFNIQNAIVSLKSKFMLLLSKLGYSEINSLESSSDELVAILNNISTLVQLSEGVLPVAKGSYSAFKLIEKSCKDVEHMHNEHIIKISVPDKTLQVYIDFNLMEMVLSNLIGNAIKFSPSKSTVEVEAKEANGFVVFSVSDEGDGIPKEEEGVLVEKTNLLNGSDSTLNAGTGLELAKAIAKIHHGYIKAENRLPKGTKFSVFIPVKQTD